MYTLEIERCSKFFLKKIEERKRKSDSRRIEGVIVRQKSKNSRGEMFFHLNSSLSPKSALKTLT
ncbi:unnamed protein product [Meloidogyne enterolobii]|uniref:Uncharacterized protein n=1 Tax=Meloidogyne enterolobii TaxID=390850 RepID=A0ACB1APL8_MELEN